MRLRSAAFIIPLFVAVVFGFATAINAQTVTANSCSQTDVQAAVNNATRGATVTVPGGSCTWSSTLSLTHGITLTGAGVGSTVITNTMGGTNPHIRVQPDSTAIANDEIIKITGFTFDGNNGTGVGIFVQGAAANGTKPFKNLVIGNNKFQNFGFGSGNGCIYMRGQSRGVIYSNTFDRCNFILRPLGNDDNAEWTNPAYTFSYGSADNLYFEDNTILYSSSYTGDSNQAMIQSEQGMRVVARYNSWNLANSGAQELWDIHGFQYYPGGETSTMVVEYYGNTITNGESSMYALSNHRGSWGLFFDNIYSGVNSPALWVDQYTGGCNSQTGIANGEVNNTYGFNNSVNGTASNMVAGPANTCSVTENVNWWNANASCTASSCTAGIGRGPSAPTGSCTTGTGYWVASTATPTASSSVIQSGKFYKCVNNGWQLYYTPYTYPHPLRGGSSSSPAPPSGLNAVVQ